jgi:hypothetical protein
MRQTEAKRNMLLLRQPSIEEAGTINLTSKEETLIIKDKIGETMITTGHQDLTTTDERIRRADPNQTGTGMIQ